MIWFRGRQLGHARAKSGSSAVGIRIINADGIQKYHFGNVQSALDGMRAASIEHVFFGINDSGENCMIHTKGNKNTHLILRGAQKAQIIKRIYTVRCLWKY